MALTVLSVGLALWNSLTCHMSKGVKNVKKRDWANRA